MARPGRQTADEIERGLRELEGWSEVDGKLHKEFNFPDFVSAFGFMTQVALHAEKLNHHPDWSNVYNTVTVDLSTHDVGGITELDFLLANRMERIVE
jgi:4a-hydroxytetrahydrobiopterin dehydratase